MSKSDKIIEILKENRAISAAKLHQKLLEKGWEGSIRKVQRYLKDLHTAGLIEANASGREIVYSVATREGQQPIDYFVSKFWTEIFDIQKEIAVADSRSIVTAYNRLRSLVMLLPKQLKNEVLPDIKSIDKRVVGKSAEIFMHGIDWKPGASMSIAEEFDAAQNFMLELQGILEKIAALLHEFGKTIEKE